MDDTRQLAGMAPRAAGRAERGLRVGRVLRMTLAGCAVGTVFAVHPVIDWASGATLLADRPWAQAALAEAGQALDRTGLPDAYNWVRKQTRALQAARFVPDQDAAEDKE